MHIIDKASPTNNVTTLIKAFQMPKSQPLSQSRSQNQSVSYNSTEQFQLPVPSYQRDTVSSKGCRSPRASGAGNSSDRSNSSKSPRSLSGSAKATAAPLHQSHRHNQLQTHILSRSAVIVSPPNTARNSSNSESISSGENAPSGSGSGPFSAAKAVFSKTSIFSIKSHSHSRTSSPSVCSRSSNIHSTVSTSRPPLTLLYSPRSSATAPTVMMSSSPSVVEARALFNANGHLLRRSRNGGNLKGSQCRRASAPSFVAPRSESIGKSTTPLSKSFISPPSMIVTHALKSSNATVSVTTHDISSTSRSHLTDHSQASEKIVSENYIKISSPTSKHMEMPADVFNLESEPNEQAPEKSGGDCGTPTTAEEVIGIGAIGRLANLRTVLTINVDNTMTQFRAHAATSALEESPNESLTQPMSSLHSSTIRRTYRGGLSNNINKTNDSIDTAETMIHADRAVIPAGRRHKRNVSRAAITQQTVEELVAPLSEAIIQPSPAQNEDIKEASVLANPVRVSRPTSVPRLQEAKVQTSTFVTSPTLIGEISPQPHSLTDRNSPLYVPNNSHEFSPSNIATPLNVITTTASTILVSQSLGHTLSQDRLRPESESLYLTSLYKDTLWHTRSTASVGHNKDGDGSILWDTSMQDLLTPIETANPENTHTMSLYMSRNPGKCLTSSMYSSLPLMSSLSSIHGSISQSQSQLHLRKPLEASPRFTSGSKPMAKTVARRSSFTSIVQNVYSSTMGGGALSSTSSTTSTEFEDRSISAGSSLSAPTSPIKSAANWLFGSQHLLHRMSDECLDRAHSPLISPLHSSSSQSRSGSVSRHVYPLAKSLPISLANHPRRRSSDSITDYKNEHSQDDTTIEGSRSADTTLSADTKNQEFFRKLKEATDLKASYNQSRMSRAEQRRLQEQIVLDDAHLRLKDSHYRTLGPTYAPPVNPLAKRRGSQIISDKDRDMGFSPPLIVTLSGSRSRSPSPARSSSLARPLSPAKSLVLNRTLTSQRGLGLSHRPVSKTADKSLDIAFEGLDPLLFKRPEPNSFKRLSGDEEIAELARLAAEGASV